MTSLTKQNPGSHRGTPSLIRELDALLAQIKPVVETRHRENQGESPVRVVLADAITPEFRDRKPDTEFPVSLDVLDQALADRNNVVVEYAFLPSAGVIRQMSGRGTLLPTLGIGGQERYDVRDADILAINMMNYLQAEEFFTLLRLSGIPARSAERKDHHPFVVLGGHIWPNPLPLSAFADAIVFGDGEKAVRRIAARVTAFRRRRQRITRFSADIPGVFVPGHTRLPVHRETLDFRRESSAAGSSYLKNGVGAIVLSRGCVHNCAFCISSHVGGEYRVKPFRQVMKQVDVLAVAGAQKIMLVAASASNYMSEGKKLADVIAAIEERGVTVRTMSDRPEHLGPELISRMAADKRKLNIAPECAPRIRKEVFRKTVSDDAVLAAVENAARAGIATVQLYCVVAVPKISPGIVHHLPAGFDGENPRDLKYLAGLAEKCLSIVRRELPRGSRETARVILDCMPMIPAPGTALQGIRFQPYGKYEDSIRTLESYVPSHLAGAVEVRAAMDAKTHFMQMLVERSGAEVGAVLHALFAGRNAGEVTADEIRRTAAEHGFDEEALSREIPCGNLPYAGMVAV